MNSRTLKIIFGLLVVGLALSVLLFSLMRVGYFSGASLCVYPNQNLYCRFSFGLDSWNENRELNKIVDQVLKDQKDLHNSGLFPLKSKGNRDAGPFLATKLPIYLRFFDSKKAVICNSAQLPNSIIPLEIRGKLEPDTINWDALSKSIDFSSIDLTWMKELERFDHWNVYKFTYQNSECQLPNSDAYLDTVFDHKLWVKLRYLKGIKEGNIVAALREVRQFARLLFTIDGNWWAWNVYRLENQFINQVGAEHIPSDWQRVSESQIGQMKRYFNSFKLGFGLGMPDWWLNQIYLNPFSELGKCHLGVGSGLEMYLMMEQFHDVLDVKVNRIFEGVQAHIESSCISGGSMLKNEVENLKRKSNINPNSNCDTKCRENFLWIFSKVGTSIENVIRLYQE